jgi:diguanylate cyclase (GGDEF)-like protein
MESILHQPRHLDRHSKGAAAWRWCAVLLIACLPWLLPAGTARAQQLSLRNFGQLDGLANLDVTAVLQDRAGYIWVGTGNGLYRSDGGRFHRYGLRHDFSDVYITALHVDPAGRMWVGSDRGLFLLDGQRPVPVLRADGKPMFVRLGPHLASVDAAHLLVQNGGRLHQVQPDGKGGWHGVPFFSPVQTTEHPELNDLYGLMRDPDGTLWMGCGPSLCRYRDGVPALLGGAEGLPAQRWDALLRDSAGTLWLGGTTHLMALPADARRFSDRTPDQFSARENTSPVTLLQDSDGRLLSASDNGVFRYAGGRWEHYGEAQGMRIGTGSHALLQDREGDLWLGLSGLGLVQWQGYRHWENWTKGQGLPDLDIWSLLRTSDGTLHAGTGNGLAQWRGRGFAVATTGVGATSPWSALAEDRNGDLWAGGFSGTLIRRHRLSGRSQVMAQLEFVIYHLLFDDAGQLWIGTDRGLFVIADPQHAPVPQRVAPTAALLGQDAGLTSACRDAGGRLWFAGKQGLLRFENGQWSRPTPPGSDGQFDFIACDGDTLWLAQSHGARLWRADATARQLQLRPLNGDLLEGRLIQSLLVDHRHWVWLGTDTGMVLWNGSRWRHFNQQSGMIWNDSNQGAILEDTDGSIWLGTSNGAAHLMRPEALFASHTIPLQVGSVRYGGAVMSGAVAPWNGAALDVRLETPFYQNREAFGFRYRLLGQENAWSSSANGEIHYAALAPGQYQLQMVADHASLQLSSAVLELPLTIQAPWWQTRWAYAGYALLSLGMVGLLHRYRVARMLRQQALLEQRVAERTAELEASREEHRLRSLKDGLTQAWNRVALMDKLTQMTAPAAPPFLLVMLDLDHFKRINDTHGHLAGDEVLREVVRRVQAQVRISDTLGRYGGEEFMLLLPGRDVNGVGPRLDLLHGAICAEPVRIDDAVSLAVTGSCGVVTAEPALRLTPEQWIGLADQALYRAKALGRNRIEYTTEVEARALAQTIAGVR